MAWWYYINPWTMYLAISSKLGPKPQNVKPAGLGDVTMPTAAAGREIGVLFGTRDLKGPNIVWYGDFRTQAVRKKGGKK